MKISVKDCLSLESLTPSILAAGRRNIENRVRSVSVMDAQDPETAEKENGIKEQLVLTSFSGLGDDEYAREEIVKRLAKAGVSAIVVFRQSNGLTSIGESVVKTAEEYGLPLIVLPRENTSLYENIIEWDGLVANNEKPDKFVIEEIQNVSKSLPKTT